MTPSTGGRPPREDGAGEGALYLSINPECRTESDGETCAAPNNADFRARFSGGQGVDWSEAEISIDRPDVYGVGDTVSVTIRYPFRLATPIIADIAQVNPLELTVMASEIIIVEAVTDDEA